MIAFADAGITTFDCADIYTGVEEHDRRVPPALPRCCAARRRSTRIRVHTKFVPDLDMLPRITRSYVEGVIDRSLQRLQDGAPRSRAVPLVGLRRAGLARGGRPSGRPAARRQDRPDRRDEFRHRRTCWRWSKAACRWCPCRCNIRCSTPAPARRMVDGGSRSTASRCSATARSPAGSSATAGWALPEPAAGFENRSLIKYKLVIDDFGGWALFQKLLQDPAPHRRPPRQRHRHRGQRRDAAAAGRRRRHRRRAQPLAPRLEPGDFRASRSPMTTMPRSTPCWRCASELDGDVFELERDRNGRHGSIMKYNLNKGAA